MLKKILLCGLTFLALCGSSYAQEEGYKKLRAEKMEKFARKNDELEERKRRLKKIVNEVKQDEYEQDMSLDNEYEEYYEESEAPEKYVKHVVVEKKEHDNKENRHHDHHGDLHDRGYYVLPAWPEYSPRFLGGDYMSASVTYKNASKMFDDLGDERDVTAKHFGCKKITFGQLFLESTLIKKGLIKSDGGDDDKNPFYYLSDAEVSLCGHVDRVEGTINYARQFWNSKFVVDITIPIVYQQNTLKYALVSTEDINVKVKAGTVIRDNFGSDINAFFNYLLSLRSFASDQCSSPNAANKTGLGDVSCSLQWNVRNNDREYVAVGARAVFPTSQNQDITLLWAPQLGNNGSPMFSGYLSAILLRNESLSPYLHGQISVGGSSSQLVRAPKLIKFSGKKNSESERRVSVDLVGRQYFGFKDKGSDYEPFEGYDSEIPAFAGSFRSVRIAPGVMFDVMLGNVFSPSFAPGLTLDVFYNLHVKSMSSIQESGYEKGDWNLEPLVQNSNRVDHHAGGQLAYQWLDYFRFSLKGGYSFAGRNNPAEIRIQVGFSADF